MADSTASSPVASLRERVESTIAGATPQIVERIVTVLTGAEIEKRAQAIMAGIAKLQQLESDLNKINKPDNVLIGLDGAKQISFTTGRYKQIEGVKKSVEKLGAALDVAVASGNLAELDKTMKELANKKPVETTDSEGE